MRDFFDEDFPLSEKEEARLKELEAQRLAKELEEKELAESDLESDQGGVDFFDEEEVYTETSAEADPEEEYTLEEEETVADSFDEIKDDLTAALISEISKLTPADQQPKDFFDEPIENSTDEGSSEDEPIEEDPIDSAPLLEMEYDEPLDDNFLPDAPIIIPVKDDDDGFEPVSDDELDKMLEELTEKLDSMEEAVSRMSDDDSVEPSYEFDERYFAEEETTAYKHPELVKKPSKPAAAKQPKRLKATLDVDLKTVAKVGAAVAGVALAVKLLSGDKKK